MMQARVAFISVISLASMFSQRVSAQAEWSTALETSLLEAANRDRLERHIQPLHIDKHLVIAARQHAVSMARHHTILHQFADEPDLASRAGQLGSRFSLITENVAESPEASEIHGLWMNSAGHRANLLDADVDAIGIGVVRDHGQFYAVEDFARSVEPLGITEQENAVAARIRGQGIALLAFRDDARETCREPSGYSGSQRPWFVMRYTTPDLHQLPAQLSARLATGRYRHAAVGACLGSERTSFTSYSIAVLLYP